jgi:hypothetical protein
MELNLGDETREGDRGGGNVPRVLAVLSVGVLALLCTASVGCQSEKT